MIQTLRSHNPSKSLAQTIRSYEAYRSFLQRLSTLLFPWTAPYFADHMTLHTHFHNGDRGIVLSTGDNQAPYLLTSIQSFRRLGCTLPIEIMYLGDSDLSEDYRAELEILPDVITRDLSQMVNDEGWRLAGWAGKLFAILCQGRSYLLTYPNFTELIIDTASERSYSLMRMRYPFATLSFSLKIPSTQKMGHCSSNTG